MTNHLGPDLVPQDASAGNWRLVSSPKTRAEGPKAVRVGDRQAIEANLVSIDDLAQPKARRNTAAARAVLLSPKTTQPLDAGKEYCASFWISADPGYDKREGKRFADVWRVVGLYLEADGMAGPSQWILAGRQGRRAAITLRPKARGRGTVALLIGTELGYVRVSDLRLQEGCAEILARRFKHGLALANGSAVSPYTFDIVEVGGGREYRRFRGSQAPHVNSGEPVGQRLTIPAQDGILLRAE